MSGGTPASVDTSTLASKVLTTKGDIATFDTARTRLGVYAVDGYCLQSDSTVAKGLSWRSVAGLGTNFFTGEQNYGDERLTNIKSANYNHGVYFGSGQLDFLNPEVEAMSISSNTTFTTTNSAEGRNKTVKILTDATLRTLTFPATWTFIGAKPTDQAASKTGILALTCFGSGDSNIVAAYAVEE
jgi:hypothetical protein